MKARCDIWQSMFSPRRLHWNLIPRKNDTGPIKSTVVSEPSLFSNVSLTSCDWEKYAKSSTYRPR